MNLDQVLGTVATFLLCVYFLRLKRQNRKYADLPIATPRLPIFGNALHLDLSQCHISLADWALKFGPVFRIKIFNEEILVLNNFTSVHEALVLKGADFAGRPPMYRTSKSEREKHSIVWQTYTEKLQFLRKEVLRSLNMYGSGTNNLERRCAPEISKMLKSIRSWDGASFDPAQHLYDAVSNIMLGLTLDTSFEHGSASLQAMKTMNVLFNETFGTGNARYMDFLPWVSRVRCYAQHQQLEAALKLRDDFWTKELLLLKKRKGSNCIVERLLSLTSDPRLKQMNILEVTAKEVFTNLILAGSDTTATALTCLLLVFLHHPEVQEKMRAELDCQVGEHRLATLSDRAHTPYVQAVLLELLRFISHVPLAVPHYTTRDTSVMGMDVPKHMTVYINLWSVHHDPLDWADPWLFKPDRFLDDSGHLLAMSHPVRRKLMTFGAGRRVCIGEALAKNRLFLFAAALTQSFRFVPSPEAELPPLDPRTYSLGIVLHPKHFLLRATPRH
jgi:cytochrome P450